VTSNHIKHESLCLIQYKHLFEAWNMLNNWCRVSFHKTWE